MTTSFAALVSPDQQTLIAISNLAPHSPFDAPAYAEALAERGVTPCALILLDGQQIVSGCLAALAGSKWNRRLEINSAPHLAAAELFWDGVGDFCRSQRVCDLDVQSFAAISPDMPHFDAVMSERSRSEFVVDLTTENRIATYSKNHKRSINKATKAGVSVTRSDTLDAYKVHVEMMRASMARRSNRGEKVLVPSVQDFDYCLLRTGAGELFQATQGDRIVASILILKAAASGYYHSAGTLPEGMQLGASPFLINEVARMLAASGMQTFNLGGVDPGADGLRRFKSGFGAYEVKLRAARFSMIKPWHRTLRRVARKFKIAPEVLLSKVRS